MSRPGFSKKPESLGVGSCIDAKDRVIALTGFLDNEEAMTELELERSRLLATIETVPQGRLGTEGNAMMTAGKISPRPAFRLLTFVLLIFALTDLLPAADMWRLVAGGVISLLFLGLMATWIGGNRIPQLAASRRQADRTATPSVRGDVRSMAQ